jgi:glycosyltransferase involved in cell wall biosynthesis
MQTRRIKIAHVITRLILGGAQQNTLYTVIGQHRDPRFDVTLIIGADDGTEGSLREEAEVAGVRLIVVPSLVRPIQPATDLRAFWDLLSIFRRERPDIVHTHSSKAGIVGRLAARTARVPIVVHTLHSLVFHEFQEAWKNRLYIGLKRLCAPLTDTLISVNQKTADGGLAAGIGRREQYVTIFSGFDLAPFLEARDKLSQHDAKRRFGLPPDPPVVGKVARLFPLKGHEQFLEAAVEIAREEPQARFLLVGDGPLRKELEGRTRKLNLMDRTVFTGRVPPEEVPACLQAMDVVVHTSLREGIARVLPQAGAVGKPVVTFAMDGAPEVVQDGVSGYLVPPLDTRSLARRVIELLGDPDRRQSFGEQGRAFACSNFDLDLMVERINGVYLELLERRAGSRVALFDELPTS